MTFSQRHYRAVSPAADTPENIRQRLIRRCACERGLADRVERFPVITSENFEAANAFQEARIAHHQKALGAQ